MRSHADLELVADHWSVEDRWETTPGLYWLQLAAVQRRWNTKMSGRADANWVDHALTTHLASRLPLRTCLSLGCGTGGLERQLAARGAFVACDACDIAEGAIRKACHAAEAAGYQHIHYSVGDLNTIEWSRARYDAVWAASAVHHVAALEHLFEQVALSLKPDGLFLLNEYIGPNRFQFPDRQRQIIQACNDLLPDEYRRIVAARLQAESVPRDIANHRTLARRVAAKLKGRDLIPALLRRARRVWARHTGTRPLRATVNLPTAPSVAALDPSEAVRLADIMPLLREYFQVVEYRPLGGGLLHFLLADIAGNFDKDAAGLELLEMLFVIEDTLMSVGLLDSDFAYIVASPKRHLVLS